MKVSVVVNNYNYESYVVKCVESAINQSYKDKEIIVVDDSSTDKSVNYLENFSQITKIFKTVNEGQAAAKRDGYLASSGELVIFLDSDDYLYENCLERVVSEYKNGVSKIQFRLDVLENGIIRKKNPAVKHKMISGDLSYLVVNSGNYIGPPTSGNVYSRSFLEKIYPFPTVNFGIDEDYLNFMPLDTYFKLLCPFYGTVISIDESLGVYRIHGGNNGANKSVINNKKKAIRVIKSAEYTAEDIQKRTGKHCKGVVDNHQVLACRLMYDSVDHFEKRYLFKKYLYNLFKCRYLNIWSKTAVLLSTVMQFSRMYIKK